MRPDVYTKLVQHGDARGQGRAGQGGAGRGKAGQGRAGQSRTGRGKPGKGRAKQGEAGKGRAKQGRAGQSREGQGKAGKGRAGQGRDSPLEALSEGLGGVGSGGQAALQDFVIVPLPPERLLQVGPLLTQLIQAPERPCMTHIR